MCIRDSYKGADPEWLAFKGSELRADLEAAHRRTKDDYITEAVWEETDGDDNPDSEPAKGWLEGLYIADQISDKLGTEEWAPCHRFGIDQGKRSDRWTT